MKITGIYAFTDPDCWCTPNSILNEFERLGHEVHRVSLLNDMHKYSDAHLIEYIASVNQWAYPDMVLFFDYGMYDSEWLDKKWFPNSFFVGEMGDEPQNYYKNFPKSHKFDMIHTPDYQSYLEYKEAGRNCIWMPHWADSSLHTEGSWKEAPPVRSTRGPGSSFILDSLSQIMPDKFLNKNGFSGEAHDQFLSAGLITVQHSRHHEYTRRIPEAMLAGSMVITDRLPEDINIDSLFVEDVDIVYYDSLPELVSKINYYLSTEGSDKREAVAASGKDKVLRYHTQKQRVETIIGHYNAWKNG